MEKLNIEEKQKSSSIWIILAFLFGISLGFILALVKKEKSEKKCDCIEYELDDDIFDEELDNYEWEDETNSYSF